jgi:hypothetical protein
MQTETPRLAGAAGLQALRVDRSHPANEEGPADDQPAAIPETAEADEAAAEGLDPLAC